YECDPRGRPYNGNYGPSGFQGGRGYDYRGGSNGRPGLRRDYDDRNFGGFNGNRGRRYNDRGQYPAQDRSRNGYSVDQWPGRGGYSNSGSQWGGKDTYDNRDKDDNIGEGTVGFYGRARRP
ncbi:hypothetical protein L9F63_025177, partial [Diploptera punctata]